MLLLRFLQICSLAVILLLALVLKANAGLYGFTHHNPYTKEERILHLSEVPERIRNYRADMRDNLLMLIRYAKKQNPDFKIVTHEGQDLLTKSQWEYDREGYNRARMAANVADDSFLFNSGYQEQEPERYTPAHDYLHLIDAVAVNNLYCGQGKESTISKNHHLNLISIEQCPDQSALDTAHINSLIEKKITYSFIDSAKAFNNIDNHNDLNDSAKNIYEIADAQNILIITDDSHYASADALLKELLATNYDIIIMKPLFADKERFFAEDLRRLHFKKNGSKRLLLAEFNVSEASPRDYFWHRDWKAGTPVWLTRASFVSPDGFITRFWHPEWKKIMSNYFKDVVNEGFDGVFFTGIENYRYFEQQTPLE